MSKYKYGKGKKKEIQEGVISLKRQQSLVLSIERFDDNFQEFDFLQSDQQGFEKTKRGKNPKQIICQNQNIIEEEKEDLEVDNNFSNSFKYVMSTKTFKSKCKMSSFNRIKNGIQQIAVLTKKDIFQVFTIFAENLSQNFLTIQEISELLNTLCIDTKQSIIESLENAEIDKILISDLIDIFELNSMASIQNLSSKKQMESKQVSELVSEMTACFKEHIKILKKMSSDAEQASYDTAVEIVEKLTAEQKEYFKNWIIQLEGSDNNTRSSSQDIKSYINEILPQVISQYNDQIKRQRESNEYQHLISQYKTIEFSSVQKQNLRKKLSKIQQENDDNHNFDTEMQDIEEEQYIIKQQQGLPTSLQFFDNNKIVLLDDIKKGGQGDIKSGYNINTQEMVIIKTFKYEYDFRLEKQIYELINNGNLDYLFLKQISIDENKPYKIIMERGACDLLQFFQLRKKENIPISKQEFLYIFHFLAKSMQILISKGIYFSDMKPENVLLQYDESVHTQLKLYLTDLGGCYNCNQVDEDFQYPNCITKFYFPLDFISNEIVKQRKNIQKEQMNQCEMYTLGRTMQSCIEPQFTEEILQKKNIKNFLDNFKQLLGEQITQILEKILFFHQVQDPYTHFEQLISDLEFLISQEKDFKDFIINNSNMIKDWQENLIKEKQQVNNVNLAELREQSKFYQKNGLYKNQESALKQIDIKLNQMLKQSDLTKENSILIQIVKNLISLGYCYQSQGKYDQALKHFIQSQQLSGQAAKKTNQHFLTLYGDSLNMIGGILQRQGKFKEALSHFQEAMDIFGELYGQNSIQQANILLNMAAIYIDIGNIDKSLQFYEQSLQIKKNFYDENHTELAYNYIGIGVCYNDSKNYDQALVNYQQCLRIYETNHIHNSLNMADVLNNIGNIYYRKKQFDQALYNYQKSLKIQQSLHGINHVNTASTIMNIAVIQKNIGNFQHALRLYNQV